MRRSRAAAVTALLRSVAVAVAVVTCTSCGAGRAEPDLSALYRYAPRSGRVPVVVVHGFMGSKLRDPATGLERWPGTAGELLVSDFGHLRLPIDPVRLEPRDDGLVPYAIFDRAAGEDFYGTILRSLEREGGYRRTGGRGADPPTLYVFRYDWRLDNVDNAARLYRFVGRVRREHGDPSLRVDVVAHSMGGLLVRYFLRYGDRDVLDSPQLPVPTLAGESMVRKVVLVGTPNRGSISGLQQAILGAPIGLGRLGPETGATWPSVYQLMPHPHRAYMLDIEGRTLDRDLYAPTTWQRERWLVYDPEVRDRVRERFLDPDRAEAYLVTLEAYAGHQLERARRFQEALSVPVPQCASRYVVFGGDCELTPSHCLEEVVGGERYIRFRPGDIEEPAPGVDYGRLMLEPGDGRVTKSSALARNSMRFVGTADDAGSFPLSYAMFLCEEHDQLPGNITFRDNLLNILLIQ